MKYLGNFLNRLQFPNSKKNSFCGNYMRKYSDLNFRLGINSSSFYKYNNLKFVSIRPKRFWTCPNYFGQNKCFGHGSQCNIQYWSSPKRSRYLGPKWFRRFLINLDRSKIFLDLEKNNAFFLFHPGPITFLKVLLL